MISFSYDQFHKEFIDLQNILNIVDIANDLEVSTEIVGCFLKDGIQPGDIINEMGNMPLRQIMHINQLLIPDQQRYFLIPSL